MRVRTSLLAGMTLAGIALGGCSSGGSTPASGSIAPNHGGSDDPALVMHQSATPSPSASGTGKQAALDPAVMPVAGPKTKSGARAAATRFTNFYFAGRFADSWQLLTEAARQAIPLDAWIAVHHACRPNAVASAGAIESVVIFGNTALVTQAVPEARPGTGGDTYALLYVNGQWAISPDDKGTYTRGSAAADIAAAKAAGYCGNRKVY